MERETGTHSAIFAIAEPVRVKARAAGAAMRALLLELDPELGLAEIEVILAAVDRAVSREMEWVRARRASGFPVFLEDVER